MLRFWIAIIVTLIVGSIVVNDNAVGRLDTFGGLLWTALKVTLVGLFYTIISIFNNILGRAVIAIINAVEKWAHAD